jgi:hypothetical protein
MARTLTIRRPTAREMQLLESFLEEEHPPQIKRRAEAILYYGLGFDGVAIAKALRVHPHTIYTDLQAFARERLACLHPLPVGGALDQDSAHPRKSQTTRRVMRERQLHWISLPKASPDGNPCETIFSDIQLNVQDNSDDPDERTMCRSSSTWIPPSGACTIWSRWPAARAWSKDAPRKSLTSSASAGSCAGRATSTERPSGGSPATIRIMPTKKPDAIG